MIYKSWAMKDPWTQGCQTQFHTVGQILFMVPSISLSQCLSRTKAAERTLLESPNIMQTTLSEVALLKGWTA